LTGFWAVQGESQYFFLIVSSGLRIIRLNQNSVYAIDAGRLINIKSKLNCGGNMAFKEIDTALKYKVADLSLAEWAEKRWSWRKMKCPD